MVTHPSTNPAEQDLPLLSGRDVVLSLWYSGSTLKILFLFLRQEKVTKRAKKKSSIPAEKIKNEKKKKKTRRRGMKVRIIIVLVIGQEAVK